MKWHSPCPLRTPGRPAPTCSWPRRLRSICSSTVGSSRTEGRLGPLAPGGRWNQTPQRPALSEMVPCAPHLPQGSLGWSRPAGHRKRCWYRAKACLGLQGSPRFPRVAACSMELGAWEGPPTPLPAAPGEEKDQELGTGARRRQGS